MADISRETISSEGWGYPFWFDSKF